MAVSLFGLLIIASTLYELRQNRINADATDAFKKTHLDYDVMKMDKVHPNNNGNGQNMELQQISVENNNDVRMNTNMQNGVICQPKILAKNGDKTVYKKEVKMVEETESEYELQFYFNKGF